MFIAACSYAAAALAYAAAHPKGGSGALGTSVAVAEVRVRLREALDTFRDGSRSPKGSELSIINASVWQTFQAISKSPEGRLSAASVRYVVHGYFARRHGWILHGLEPFAAGPAAAETSGADRRQERTPTVVDELLESWDLDYGLGLDDVVAMIATIEHLLLMEAASLLETSYNLNSLSPLEPVEQAELEDVLISYLVLFGQGSMAQLSEPEYHQELKDYLAKHARLIWTSAVDYQRDHILNYDFARGNNPFHAHRYSFRAALDLALAMAHGYGRLQSQACSGMKEALVRHDPAGTGRVPLGAFSSGAGGETWYFSESVDTLRRIGVLDESHGEPPQVIIANYLAQPTNCIASSSYYSVCCLSECRAIMDEIEHVVRAPTASAELLLEAVESILAVTADGRRAVPEALAKKLREVDAEHGGAGVHGEVALHGQFFSQWLHFVFPHECAYPGAEGTGTPEAGEWLDVANPVREATHEDRPERPGGARAAPGPRPWWRSALRLLAQAVTLAVVAMTIRTFAGKTNSKLFTDALFWLPA